MRVQGDVSGALDAAAMRADLARLQLQQVQAAGEDRAKQVGASQAVQADAASHTVPFSLSRVRLL